MAMTFAAQLPSISSISLPTLQIPAKFTLAGGRALLVPLFAVPVKMRLLALVPAALLTCLFFLDQNISVRVVNQPTHRLKKGPAYHLDMLALSVCTMLSSLCGLPWMCAATVQSLNHVKALATYSAPLEPTKQSPVGQAEVATPNADVGRKSQAAGGEQIVSVVENRLSGLLIHSMLAGSVLFLPLLRKIPMAVISGLFLYLGRNMMSGNEFLRRIRMLFVDPTLYPEDSPMRKVRPRTVNLFTALQIACLGMLWALKVNPKTSLFFPSVIGTLMVIRSQIASRIFPQSALEVLDSDVAAEVDAPEDADAEYEAYA